MSGWHRWVDNDGISDLSIAIDEIYRLRAMLADEADIIEAHLSLKSFPKSRREIAEQQIERMTTAASGDLVNSQRENFNVRLAFRRNAISETLTNAQWAEQRGLHEAKDD